MFAEEFVIEGQKSPALGPAYFDARRVAERFMAQFEAEQFKPLIDKFTKEFADEMWKSVSDWLLSDTESNLQSELWRIADNCVKAILGGERWALEKYALGERYDCDKVRETVARHIPQELQDKRVADLEEQVKKLQADLAFWRDRR